MTYRISPLRRLCSATSPGGVAKSVSSAAMRERMFWILFLTARVSCGYIRQRVILSRRPRANFVVGIDGGDGPQDGFERTESIYKLFCDIIRN